MTDWELKRARRHADRCRALTEKLTFEGEAMVVPDAAFMGRHRAVRKAWMIAEIVWFEEMARRNNYKAGQEHADWLRGRLARLGYVGEV